METRLQGEKAGEGGRALSLEKEEEAGEGERRVVNRGCGSGAHAPVTGRTDSLLRSS